MSDPRGGRPWATLVARCKRTYPWVCHLCGQPIPHGLHQYHPLSYQADHVLPAKTHPHLVMVLANLAPSHRKCNNWRKAKPLTPSLVAECTARFAPAEPRPALTFFD